MAVSGSNPKSSEAPSKKENGRLEEGTRRQFLALPYEGGGQAWGIGGGADVLGELGEREKVRCSLRNTALSAACKVLKSCVMN